jgi:hypothetical protein
MRTLRLIPDPQGGSPVSSDNESFTYSTDDEAAVEIDSFESSSPITSRLPSSLKPEYPLVSTVKEAIKSESLTRLSALLEDADLVKSINQPHFNAMDMALAALMHDKENPLLLKVVALLKEKGAVPNVMKADASYWCGQLVSRAEALVKAAKILSFQNK